MNRKNHIRPQLYFTKKERRAYYFIICMMISIYALGRFLPNTLNEGQNIDDQLSSIVDNWEVEEEKPRSTFKTKSKSAKSTRYKKEAVKKRKYSNQEQKSPKRSSPTRYAFDPNTINKDSLKQLGFSSKTATIIEKYRSKNGQFKKGDDLKKIYGIDTNLVNSLNDFIQIKKKNIRKDSNFIQKTQPPTAYKASEKHKEISIIKTVFIDINEADTYEWMQLRGIGERKAEIIVDRRSKLGGFHSKEQLMNVWGINDSLYYSFEEQLVESSIYKKIPINTIEKDSLAKHPYFTFKKAMMLSNYRRNHGPFKSIDDLKLIRPFDEFFLEKIEPYLDFNL